MLEKAKTAVSKITKTVAAGVAAKIKSINVSADGTYDVTVDDKGENKTVKLTAAEASGLAIDQNVQLTNVEGKDTIRSENPAKVTGRNSPVGITIPSIRY